MISRTIHAGSTDRPMSMMPRNSDPAEARKWDCNFWKCASQLINGVLVIQINNIVIPADQDRPKGIVIQRNYCLCWFSMKAQRKAFTATFSKSMSYLFIMYATVQ